MYTGKWVIICYLAPVARTRKIPMRSFLLGSSLSFPGKGQFLKGLSHLSGDTSLAAFGVSQWRHFSFLPPAKAKMELPSYTQVIICTMHQWFVQIIPGQYVDFMETILGNLPKNSQLFRYSLAILTVARDSFEKVPRFSSRTWVFYILHQNGARA